MNYSAERDKEIYQLLYTIYDQRIHSAKKVLECTVFQGGSSKQPEVDDIYKLFMACFIRWINGHGHPIELVGDFIEKTTYLAALPDSPPVTRAQLFFEALSDSNLLPITGFTEIMVSRLGDFPQAVKPILISDSGIIEICSDHGKRKTRPFPHLRDGSRSGHR
jgi:hypothetical protein